MDKAAQHVTTGIAIGLAVLLVAVAVPPNIAPAEASHEPADRAAATGSTLEVMESTTADGEFSEVHTVLSTEMRTSSTSDLVLELTAECALWTDVTTVGNDESESYASVKAWVEVDGEPVPVTSDGDDEETGVVTLCNREYRVATMAFENENATIERYLRTKTANAFNWIQLDAGSGVHDIEVKVQLEGHAETETGEAQAKALIGKRTLVIEPVKMPHDAEI
jgi:hypothetical protein